MTSSDPARRAKDRLHGAQPQAPAANAHGAKGTLYSRFIPREELSSFAAWNPDALAGGAPPEERRGVQRAAKPAPPPPPAAPVEDTAELLRAARQQAYQDGYRDGLVALDGFKQTFAAQTTAQVGTVVASLIDQLDGLQQQMAAALAQAASDLARQVVRSELATRPELVADVAIEALETLLLSARHITVHVHPDDHALVAHGASEALAGRGARLLADPAVSRGGCLVESDVGVVDAGIENRWRRAAAAIGQADLWSASQVGGLEP